MATTRRGFLRDGLGATALGLGGLGLLRGLPPVTAGEMRLDPRLVRLESGIEPLVRFIETTPRDSLLEQMAEKIRQGTSYQEVLAALMLASVRNVQPRPSVGFKFHAVLVVNSAHLASLAAPDQDRWLPLFWALDYGKAKQLEEERTSGWKMPPVDEQAVPRPSQARSALIEALDRWDAEAADAAAAGLVRSAGAHEVFGVLWSYGARDFRSIGHKAIFVANACRTLQCIGWHHAEPVVRSLVFALVNHTGDPHPAESDQLADKPWRQNGPRSGEIRADWLDGDRRDEAVSELIAVIRQGSHEESASAAVDWINQGTAPGSIWDAVFVASGELLMRQPGIIGLHGLTTANALHYAYQTCGQDDARKKLLLQACSFVPLFRESARSRGNLQDTTVDQLTPRKTEAAEPAEAVAEIFADVSGRRTDAAAKILQFLQDGGSAEQLTDAARGLVFVKGNDAHDYKFSSAVLEDYQHLAPGWREKFLALSVFNLPGSGDRDNQLIQRARQALS